MAVSMTMTLFHGAASRTPTPPFPAPGRLPAPGFRHALRASPPATTTQWSGGEQKPRAGGQGPPGGALGRLETRKGLSGRERAKEGRRGRGKRGRDYSLGAFLGADLVLAFSANN